MHYQKLFLTCIAALFINASARAQVISLDDCVNAYRKDTSFFKELHVQNVLPVDTTMVKGGMYARALKSRTNPDNSLMKVVAKDSADNQFIYSFDNTDQYTLLRTSLRSGNYKLFDSTAQTANGMRIATDMYLLNDLFITLLKVGNEALHINSYTILIRKNKEKKTPVK